MKLHILSDLHTEFADFEPPQTDADVVVLAGDIGVGYGGLEWANSRFPDACVIYVPGNHEYYHHDLAFFGELRGNAPKDFHVLNNAALVVDGVRFIGCTLWTDFALFGRGESYFSKLQARQDMADFSLIQNNGKRFTPEDSVRLHEESRVWITAKFEEPFDGKTVVITHHLPSSRSVAQRFATHRLTPAFASALESLIDAGQPALWIHGHTHDPSDYEIYNTRVVCNPRGYPGEIGISGFKPGLVVEI